MHSEVRSLNKLYPPTDNNERSHEHGHVCIDNLNYKLGIPTQYPYIIMYINVSIFIHGKSLLTIKIL